MSINRAYCSLESLQTWYAQHMTRSMDAFSLRDSQEKLNEAIMVLNKNLHVSTTLAGGPWLISAGDKRAQH
jgi:hypothetical protein